MTVNLPNQITLLRLLIAVVFFVLLARVDVTRADQQVLLIDVCAILFIIAAGTDWLDGHLARRRKQVTSLGKALDPFVDKVLVCGSFVFLCGPAFQDENGAQTTCLYPWMVVLILGRELLVTGLRGFVPPGQGPISANVYGKAKMVIQSITVPVLLVFIAHIDRLPDASPQWRWIKLGLVWLTVIATTLSMFTYLHHARYLLSSPTS